jgi:hypothetical protein
MGFTDPASVKRIGAMLNADYLVVGPVTIQMIEVQTGRVTGSAVLQPSSWEDYVAKVPAAVRGIVNRIPRQAENVFGGAWEASVEHDGLEDPYEIDFKTAGKCTATVYSCDRDNRETVQSAEGIYALNSGILSVNVNFRRGGTLRHLTRIEWKAAFTLNLTHNSGEVSFLRKNHNEPEVRDHRGRVRKEREMLTLFLFLCDREPDA